jgi:acyl-CoA synthetase (AMP-forming)/AMP-acid ligase II
MLSHHSTRSVLLDWLHEPSGERGISFATSDGWRRLSWEEIARLSWRVAGGLIEDGLNRGDRVALVGEGGPELVAALFGALLAGAVPSLCPPPLPFQGEGYSEHLSRLILAAAPVRVLTQDGLEPQVDAIAAAAGAPVIPIARLAAAAPAAGPRPPAAPALVQVTSGSTGRPRPVPVALEHLEANIAAIQRWLGITEADATASWLPVHHDMGLTGCLLTPASSGTDLYLMSPQEFVRRPLRYLRCFHDGGAQLSAMPGFGLEHIVRRVQPEALDGLELGSWRTLIVGAERIQAGALEAFERLLAPYGFSRRALAPAYGLAEATLAVTGVGRMERWRSLEIDPGAGFGQRVESVSGCDRVVGCGRAVSGVRVRIADAEGRAVPEGTLGEIVVDGACTAGVVFSGDAGFLQDGELFVLGRLGDGLKLRGRFVFAEAIESELVASGLPSRLVAAILGHVGGTATAVAVLETPGPAAVTIASRILRRRAAGARSLVVAVERGAIPRTSSGKPRRRELWSTFAEGRLTPIQPSERTALSQEGAHA